MSRPRTASRLTLAGIRTRGIDVRLSQPIETAAGVLRSEPFVLLELSTTDDVIGRSYVRCHSPLLVEPVRTLVDGIAAMLRGRSADPVDVRLSLQPHFVFAGERGVVSLAMAAIDMALWDAGAVADGVPLATALGAKAARPIRAYATVAAMAPGPAAEQAGALVERGFAAIKVKLGRGDLDADVEVLRAVRSAIGDRALMVDYNQTLTPDEAVRRLQVLDEAGLTWIEEPVPLTDLPGAARVAAAAMTPLQSGEEWASPEEVAAALEEHATDLVMLDAGRTGGVSGWMEAAAVAAHRGVPVSSHAYPEVSVHLLTACPTGDWLEVTGRSQTLVGAQLELRDGMVVAPQTPGTGITWAEPW